MLKNTNISYKERHVFTINDLRGVDLSSSPFDVSSNRAVDMRNLIKENGVTQKRKGWRQNFAVGNESILGLYHYKNGSYESLIVVTSSGVYSTDIESGELKSSYTYKNGKKAKRAEFFFSNGVCYIITGIDFISYKESDESLEIKRVFDADPYVPITSVSYGKNEIWAFESVNLLTNKRKNLFVYEKDNEYKLDSVPYIVISDVESQTFNLKYESDLGMCDLTPNIVKQFSITEEEISAIGGYFDEEKGIYRHTITDTLRGISGHLVDKIGESKPIFFKVKDFDPDGNYIIKLYADGEMAMVIGEAFEDDRDYTEIYGCASIGEITIKDSLATVRISEGYIEAEIEFTPKGYEAKPELVDKCDIGTLFGVEGNSDCMFISGNPDEPNMIRFSWPDDFTYFPDNHRLIFGSSETPIAGFSRLTDSTLAVLKYKTNNESTIYYVTGKAKSEYDDTGELERLTLEFTPMAGNVGEGCVSNRANRNFLGESIVLSQGGVYGIVAPSGNLTTNTRYAKNRSYSLSAELREKDLSGAVATVHENRYYLCVGDKCYVADADYKYYRENDADESYNYEWWVWDNVPATAIASIKGQLMFGTNDGRVCVFDENYTDRQREVFLYGNMTLKDGYAVFKDTVTEMLSDGYQTVRFGNSVFGYIGMLRGTEDGFIVGEEINGEFYINDEYLSKMYVGMVIHSFGSYCIISAIDRGEGKITLTNPVSHKELIRYGETADCSIDLSGMELTVEEDVDENGEKIFWFLRPGTAERIKVHGSSGSNIYVTKHMPVIAQWKTPYLDMGTNMQGKTIHSFTVSCECDNGGTVNLGYETRKMRGEVKARSAGTFSFKNFSFEGFTFENGFAASHTVRHTIRDFNYIQFVFSSDSPHRCALHDFSAVYKINKMNRGVK